MDHDPPSQAADQDAETCIAREQTKLQPAQELVYLSIYQPTAMSEHEPHLAVKNILPSPKLRSTWPVSVSHSLTTLS